ncbi:PAS domain S-box [Mizugakiibacter sediminis]|uniref:histidine kinase n=1 Tax=Mizugakiibacter sediminis TaxID=1475481 RepID=A0A0K8QJV2_9GAMM|nr:response regulator [Mizugakiibacter sediminis]GAP65200.1 PAS domain S-box [Mizugakiibacter sediminis]
MPERKGGPLALRLAGIYVLLVLAVAAAGMLAAPLNTPLATVVELTLIGAAGWIAVLLRRLGGLHAQLRDRARLQQDLFRYSGLLITVKDREGRIVEANDAVAAGFGRPVAEMLGTRLADLLPAESAAEVMARDREVMESGRETSHEETVPMPDGEHVFLAKRFPVRDAQGNVTGIAALRVDITAHVRLEQALRLAKAEAEAANLTKSAFLANMSHELRTPLNTIIGLSELVAEELAERGQAHFAEPMRRVVAAGRHLLALINDILDLSRIEAGRIELHPEPCRLHDLIDTVVGVVQPLADANGNRIEVHYADDPGVLSLDSTRVKQILLNLLSNACKFTRAGDVRVDVDTVHDAHGSRLVIAVADTGIGIEAEQMERIFEPFRQADQTIARRFGGTGLGLSICRQLCNLMGGALDVASTPGAGSVFTLSLPLLDGPLARAHEAVARAAAADRRELIVVADDEPDARMLIAGALQREGFEVRAAGSGAETLALVRQARPALLVLDILLGDMSGWDVLTAVRADPATRHLPVIVCTITDADRRAASLGVVEHMIKPFDREHLLALARRFVRPKHAPHVVVADDDAEFRGQIVRRLQTEGWRVREAPDGLETLAALRRQPPDLLLLDLMMPNLDGMAVLEAMREDPRLDRIPVILVSAAELSPEQVRALNRRAVEFVRKCGGDLETMLARVRATLAALDPQRTLQAP